MPSRTSSYVKPLTNGSPVPVWSAEAEPEVLFLLEPKLMTTALLPAPPAGTQPADRARWLALALLATTQFVLILDAAIVGVALPSIAADLDLAQSDLSWIGNAYTLLFGGFLLLGGRLADLLGRRRLFVSGLVLFTAASLVAGLADSGLTLVGARAVQGFAAALVSPAALSLVMILFKDGAERNRALGIWGAVAGSGAAAGLVLGGVLTDWFGWASVFFVNVPIGIAAVLLAFRLLPRSESVEGTRHFALAGAAPVTAGLALLVYVLVDANDAGWLSGQTLGLGALAVALLVAFVVVELRSSHPLVPMRIFAAPMLRGANTVAVLTTMAMFPMFFFITLYTQQVLGYSPIESGLAQLPFALTIVVVASSIGPVIARLGLRTTAITGLVLMAIGLTWISRLSTDGTFLSVLFGPMLITAAGAAFAFISMTIAATNGASEHEAGLASGLINTAQQIGGALGLGILVAVATARTESVVASGEPSVAVAVTEGYSIGLLVGGALALTGAVMAAIMLPRRTPAVEPVAHLAAEPEPVGGLADEPGADPAAAVRFANGQIGDVGPGRRSGCPVGLAEVGVDLDMADGFLADDGPDPGAVHAQGATRSQPRMGCRPAGQLVDPRDQDDLGTPGMTEAGLLVDRPNVRPLLGHPIDGRHRQGPVGIGAGHAPSVQMLEASRGEHLARFDRVGPARHRRPAQQPADLARITVRVADRRVGAVAQHVRSGDNALALLGDQCHALLHPGIDDVFARVALEVTDDRRHRQGHARQHGGDMGVHQRRELLSVTAAVRAHLDRGHGELIAAGGTPARG